MTKRILSRASAGSGRVDDNIETLKKRFASNTKDTLPVIEYYDSIGKVVKVCTNKITYCYMFHYSVSTT